MTKSGAEYGNVKAERYTLQFPQTLQTLHHRTEGVKTMVAEIMSTGLKEATKQARAAWLCKATLVNETLPRDQLHGLCRLLLDHRDALIKNLCEESERSDVFWEQELAILMEDLYALILYLNSAKAPRYTRRTKHDTFELVAQPKGLCLVLCDPDWLLRSALAAIAAAIAARNTVILGVTKPSKTFELLQCNIPQYLDSFTVHFVQCNPRSISHGLYDDICVIGTEASICFEENTVHKGLYSVSEASACTVLRNYPDVTYRCVDHSIDVGFIDETQSPNASMYVEAISRHLGILSGIFIPQQHQKIALDAIGGLDRHQQSKGGSSRKLLPGCTRISPSVSGIDLSQCATSTDLIGLLDRAQQNHETILFWTTSREHVLDALGRISRTLNQVALLSRPPKKIETYLINWLRSSKVSTGAFRRDIPEVIDSPIFLTHDIPITKFPITMFWRWQLTASQINEIRNSIESASLNSVQKIRSSYDQRLPKLIPVHPGGRIDFFVQVGFAVKAAATIIGVCSIVGAFWAIKRV